MNRGDAVARCAEWLNWSRSHSKLPDWGNEWADLPDLGTVANVKRSRIRGIVRTTAESGRVERPPEPGTQSSWGESAPMLRHPR